MIRLEYYNGEEWVFVSNWESEGLAWISLGGDDSGYRTVCNKTNEVLTEK